MADSTIQGLTSIEEIVDNDLMLVWDSSAVTDNTKKVTTQNLTKYIGEKSQASFTTNSNNKNVQLTLGGRNVTNGMTFDVTFLSTVIAENETDTMTITYNGVNLGNIVVGKDGVTQNMKCVGLDGTYKFLQAYTTLTLKYIENVGCLVMGNPIVLSSAEANSGYTIYADGYCVQYGETATPATQAGITINHFPVSNKNIHTQIMMKNSKWATSPTRYALISLILDSSFCVQGAYTSVTETGWNSYDFYWEVRGYI